MHLLFICNFLGKPSQPGTHSVPHSFSLVAVIARVTSYIADSLFIHSLNTHRRTTICQGLFLALKIQHWALCFFVGCDLYKPFVAIEHKKFG
jgi:hypothetical protein